MTFGRPWAIPQASIKIRRPMPFPNDHYPASLRSAPYHEAGVQFFDATVQVHRIWLLRSALNYIQVSLRNHD